MAAPQPPREHRSPEHGPSPEPNEHTCLWCPYTGSMKQVMRHTESAHHRRWCDLALYLPIGAGEPYPPRPDSENPQEILTEFSGNFQAMAPRGSVLKVRRWFWEVQETNEVAENS
jgi:hypothetical protein